MLGVAVDAVRLLHFFAVVAPGLAGAGVHVEEGVIAGGDGHADAVAGVEDLAGGPAIDADLLDLAGRGLLWSRGDFVKTRFVVFVIRAHEAVPVVEVEAVVAAHFLVMLDVIGRRVQQLAKPGLHEPVREVFKAGVAADVEDNLPDHEGKEGQWMHRYGEDKEWEDAGLHEGLQRGEGIRGPGAGVRIREEGQ